MQHVTSTVDRDASALARNEDAEEVRTIARWLGLGSLIPLVGWVYAVGLLWAATVLPRRAKVLGSLLFPGGWFGALVAAVLITRESSGYCYTSSGGPVGGSQTVESGCVQTGAFSPAVGFALLVLVLVAAGVGPAYVRRQGLRLATPSAWSRGRVSVQ